MRKSRQSRRSVSVNAACYSFSRSMQNSTPNEASQDSTPEPKRVRMPPEQEDYSLEEMIETPSGRFYLKDSDQEFVQTESGRFVFKSPDRRCSYVLPKSDWPVRKKRSATGTFFTILALAFAIGFAVFVFWYVFFSPNQNALWMFNP